MLPDYQFLTQTELFFFCNAEAQKLLLALFGLVCDELRACIKFRRQGFHQNKRMDKYFYFIKSFENHQDVSEAG